MTRHSAPGRNYAPRRRERLTPEAIRGARFRPVGLLRHGVDAKDVESFMARVADDMASLYSELAEVYAENHRVKVALTTWQTARISAQDDGASRRL